MSICTRVVDHTVGEVRQEHADPVCAQGGLHDVARAGWAILFSRKPARNRLRRIFAPKFAHACISEAHSFGLSEAIPSSRS